MSDVVLVSFMFLKAISEIKVSISDILRITINSVLSQNPELAT